MFDKIRKVIEYTGPGGYIVNKIVVVKDTENKGWYIAYLESNPEIKARGLNPKESVAHLFIEHGEKLGFLVEINCVRKTKATEPVCFDKLPKFEKAHEALVMAIHLPNRLKQVLRGLSDDFHRAPIFKNMEVVTLGDFEKISRREILSVHDCGTKKLTEILNVLHHYGIYLTDEKAPE